MVLALCTKVGLDFIDRKAPRMQEQAQAQQTVQPLAECDREVPASGASHDYRFVSRNAMHSPMLIENRHAFPAMVILNAADGAARVRSVFLEPDGRASIEIPVGRYLVDVQVGHEWCNFDRGFDDGVWLDDAGEASVSPGTSARLSLLAMGSGAQDVMISHGQNEYADAEPPGSDSRLTKKGTMELVRQNGHYYVGGSINGQKVTFMVDTGATVTAISQAVADIAKLENCRAATFNTANGVARGCIGYAQTVTFGKFRLNNVEVSTGPGMMTPLLGMNVLSYFHLEQKGDVLRISVQ